MTWQEQGGPPVTAPTRLGFGSTVIGRMVGTSFGSTPDIDFAAGGFRWHIDCRAEAALESDSLRQLVMAAG